MQANPPMTPISCRPVGHTPSIGTDTTIVASGVSPTIMPKYLRPNPRDKQYDRTILQSRTERIVLLVLAAVQFTSIVDFMVVMPLGPQLMRSLAIGPTQFGLIVSSYTFAAGAAGLVASSVVDRFSRRAAFLTL